MGRFITYIGSPCSAMRKVQAPKIGDIIVKNSVTNKSKIVSYEEWLQLEDAWDITGLYGITTYEEENAENGYYVIMSNGVTLIIAPEDFNKVSNNWEQVDTIVIDLYNGHDYVEIGGLKWATMNVGANSITDPGLYFQWGDVSGYTASQVGTDKIFNWANYKYTTNGQWNGINKYQFDDGHTNGIWYDENENFIGDNKTVLEPMDDAAITNWGGSWRIPTTAEFQVLSNAVNTAWTDDYQSTGVAGMICTAKDGSGAQLFFPAMGCARNDRVDDMDSSGYYWSSSLYDNYSKASYQLNFTKSGAFWNNYRDRYCGCHVRGVVG